MMLRFIRWSIARVERQMRRLARDLVRLRVLEQRELDRQRGW